MAETVKHKFQFGAAGRKMSGWDCYDMEVNIRNPLPFPAECATHIHCEHLIEHVTHQEAWNYLSECYRILDHSGRIRVAIPDVARMYDMISVGFGNDYMKAASPKEPTLKGTIHAAVFSFGHQAFWTGGLLYVVLAAVGFAHPGFCGINESEDPIMRGLEQHGKVVGEEINYVETTVVEAIKP